MDKQELKQALDTLNNAYDKGYFDGHADKLKEECEYEIEEVHYAHWERPYPTTPKSYTRICSRCKGTAYVIGKYEYPRCPHCGAFMRKENEK